MLLAHVFFSIRLVMMATVVVATILAGCTIWGRAFRKTLHARSISSRRLVIAAMRTVAGGLANFVPLPPLLRLLPPNIPTPKDLNRGLIR